MMWRSSGVRLTMSALVLAATNGGVEAARRVNTDCRMRLEDGEVIAADTRKLPQLNAGFKVLHYKASRTSDGWSFGPCVLEPRS